jgi:hypothetical protein
MIATLTEVATALIEAEVPLVGDLLVGLADGGMPLDISARRHAGMSNGVTHLINRGGAPDFAIVMKPWNWVYHEEPGMGWFKLRVHGTLGYAGVPRGTPGFRSSVVPAARVIQDLEQWIIEYAERNTSGQIKPHGWIAGVRGGNPERPAFPSAVTEIFFDVRINPRTSPAEVKTQFAEFVRDLQARRPELVLDWEMYGSVAGGSTDAQNWICAVRPAWLGAYRAASPWRGRPARWADRRCRAASSRHPHCAHRLAMAGRRCTAAGRRGAWGHGRDLHPGSAAVRQENHVRTDRHPDPAS